MSPFWSKKHDFRGPFWHRFFVIFVNVQKPWNRWQFYTFTSFWPSKTFHFSIEISLFFHVFSKPLPGSLFRGSRCRSLLKSWILVPFSILGISKKAPFGRHFRAILDKNPNFFLPERSLNRPFLNIVFFGCFIQFWRTLDGFGALFWFLLPPFWLPFRSHHSE